MKILDMQILLVYYNFCLKTPPVEESDASNFLKWLKAIVYDDSFHGAIL